MIDRNLFCESAFIPLLKVLESPDFSVTRSKLLQDICLHSCHKKNNSQTREHNLIRTVRCNHDQQTGFFPLSDTWEQLRAHHHILGTVRHTFQE